MLEFETYLTLFWRWLWFLILGAILGIGVAYFILDQQELLEVYEATATVTIGAQLEAAVVSSEELSIGQDLVPNFVVLAERPPITDNVINNLGLDISTKELVDNKLDVVQQGQTRVVLIIGKDQDPRIAAAIANETARQLRDTGPLRPTELIQIVALAPVPTNPSSEIYLILGLSALAGLFLAALIAVLIELKRDRPQTLSWAASRMDLPILGSFKLNKVLPRRRRWFGRIQSPDKWPTPAQVWWVVMEAFHKMLKMTDDTSLAEANNIGHTIVVNSAKSTRSTPVAAVELARAWAASGSSVILIDADLKQSAIYNWLGTQDEPGLFKLLEHSEDADFSTLAEQQLLSTPVPNLRIVRGGVKTANTMPLLNRKPWQQVMAALCQLADVVIVNSPAVDSGPEAMVLASQASGVLHIADLGKIGSADVNEAAALLANSGSHIIGMVMNK
ncbi:MAG: hypothetical protein M9928_11585 [Anaerolineae bacterium]|nr:hypothetical protein [Anaerolineae bacterium]MCO5205667.1 hypothetical protein [Anaerolineae bacterium]